MYRCAADSPWNSSSVADWPLRPHNRGYWITPDHPPVFYQP